MKKSVLTAEILCVGTELLLGDIVNTNAAYLSRQLAELGIRVYKHTAVGDNPERLRRALDAAFAEADLVITSGGLGPTYDDLTKETVAAYFGKKMMMHEESLAAIKAYFERTGRVMTKNNEKQAVMPEGATVFPNHYGTAPSLAITGGENDSKTVIMLPGPPGELTRIFPEQVRPYLEKRRGTTIVSKNIHIFGMGESAVETCLADLMTKAQNPTVAPYCKEGEVRLRVTAESESREKALLMCDEMIEAIRSTPVGEVIYGVDIDSIENALAEALKSKGKTMVAAESCTGGLIAKRMTDISGVSSVFLGGCVTYTNEVKMDLLGVKKETLDAFGAVSAETAAEMAEGVRKRLGADIGVSATGIAGPTGGTAETPVGTVFIGVSREGKTVTKKLSLSSMRSRDYIRIVSASNAFDMALKMLSEI